jgi:hypothetical protein
MSRSYAIAVLIAVVGLASCSADDGEVADTTTTPTQPTPSVTFLSEPIDAGPLLGRGSQNEDSTSAAPIEPCLDDDENCEDFDDLGADALPQNDPFVPAPEDAAFCSALEDFEARPFPSDEFEAIIVIQAWFVELRPTVPRAHVEDFAVLTRWLDVAVESGGQVSLEDGGDEIDEASDRLGEYVDTNCYG